jgi:hypothetical protein
MATLIEQAFLFNEIMHKFIKKILIQKNKTLPLSVVIKN